MEINAYKDSYRLSKGIKFFMKPLLLPGMDHVAGGEAGNFNIRKKKGEHKIKRERVPV
jgi:hypothetical protein